MTTNCGDTHRLAPCNRIDFIARLNELIRQWEIDNTINRVPGYDGNRPRTK